MLGLRERSRSTKRTGARPSNGDFASRHLGPLRFVPDSRSQGERSSPVNLDPDGCLMQSRNADTITEFVDKSNEPISFSADS
jgi:hypothetical protein